MDSNRVPVRGAIWRRGSRREVRRSLVFTAKEAAAAAATVGAMAKEEEEDEEKETAAAMASVTGHCI